ncbi:titin-like [Lineus longissimus]|uniref:titin-like n=1 Tax=Lineus longissimus TaxID=88925 RepID=UPI00315DEFCF
MIDMYSDRFPFLLLSLGLLLAHILHGALGITVKNSLSNSRPRLGETITFECNIGIGTAKSVSWYKDKNDTRKTVYLTHNCSVFADKYKSRLKQVQCDTHNYNFQLSDVQISDHGKWQCDADGVEAEPKLKLDVLVPHSVQVKVSKPTVTEHEFVRFECLTSGGNPEFVTRYQWLWKKSSSTEEQVIQDTETSTQNGKYLEFTRIPYDESGTYSCKASNDGGMGQASTVLNVQYSPRIDPEAKMKYDVAGEIGKEAMFELFIVANPTPTKTDYTWSKDGNVLSRTSPDYEITSGPTSSELKIKDVKSLDYTNYSCSVKTSAFQATIFNFMLNKAASYTSDLSNSVSVNTKASNTSDLSNGVLVNTKEATHSSKETNKTFKVGIGFIAVGGSLVVISIVIGIVIIVIKHKKSSGKKKGDDQESQDNVVTGQSALLGGQVNHAMRLPLPRSECDPNENRNRAKSKLRTPDVVSDTNQYVESALHVPVGKNGSQKEVRPTLLRPTQPASPAKEHLYENVKRKIQPQQKSGSGGVPKQIGVDGTVYAKLSFQPAKHDHPVGRTEEQSPYSTVDFSRKAPPLEEEEEVLVQYIT